MSPVAGGDREARDELVSVERDGIQLFLDPSGSPASRSVLERRNADRATMAVLERQVRPGMTVVDVGARVGCSALVASRLVGPRGRVAAVEPDAANCRLLLLSAWHNESSNVTVWPVALHDHQGWAHLARGGLSTGVPGDLTGAVGTVVPTFALDQLLHGPIDVLRLDASGAEPLILAGAQRLLCRRRTVIVAAVCPEALQRVAGCSVSEFLGPLVSAGYRLARVEVGCGSATPIGDLAAFAGSIDDPRRQEHVLLVPA
jgi:FkbM family methyltransferase